MGLMAHTDPADEELSQLMSTIWKATAVQHPTISGLALILWSYYPKVPFQILRFVAWRIPKALVWDIPKVLVWDIPKGLTLAFLRSLGFGEKGPRYNSYASQYQRDHYGGYIPKDSEFSRYQSWGARGLPPSSASYNEKETSGLWAPFSWGLFVVGIRIALAGLLGQDIDV